MWAGLETPMRMFVKSIGRVMGLWRVCTCMVEFWRGITRLGGQRWRYQLVEVKSRAPFRVVAGETRGMRIVGWVCLHDAAGKGQCRWTRRNGAQTSTRGVVETDAD